MTLPKKPSEIPDLLRRLCDERFYGEVTIRLTNGRISQLVTSQSTIFKGDGTNPNNHDDRH